MTVSSMAVPVERTLASPVDLEKLIGDLIAALEAGVLVEATDRRSANPRIDLKALVGAATWPDIIDAEFVDQLGSKYRLFVDTYHGNGRWSRLEE